MNFVTWSIRNPVPVIVMFVALTVAGLVSFAKLGVQDRPDVELPAVVVTIAYPGVPPSQLESEVTRKIEDAVATVDRHRAHPLDRQRRRLDDRRSSSTSSATSTKRSTKCATPSPAYAPICPPTRASR